MRILVVDDHELTRFCLKVAFQRQPDIELVGLATNGQEAVDLVKETHPAVVILDLQMPVMDGAIASHKIKTFDPKIKIIGYSSMKAAPSRLVETAELDALCDKSASAYELIDLAWELLQKDSCK